MVSRELRWVWLAGFALAVAAYAPALWQWEASGWGDWQQFHHWWEVGRIALIRWGEFPLFDPHHCGGVPMWGQPQMQYLAPTWWLTGLLFGTVPGHKLFILLHHAVGFAGMFVVCRRLYRLGALAACLAAMTWAFSGYFAWRGAGGHGTFLAFHYIPWILFCWRRTHDDLRYAGGVAALMALQLAEGGTYPFPLTFLFLFVDALAQLARGRWAVIRTALITGVLTALCGAVRLWPIYATMSRFPRETRMEDSQTIADVLESLTAREPHDWVWGHRWVWAEYGAFIGWTAVALAGYGVWVAFRRRRYWHLPIAAAVFAACAMGNVGPLWPWPVLHELPVFGNFHVPSRFHVLLTFELAILAALGVDAFSRAMRRDALGRRAQRAVTIVTILLCLSVATDVLSNSIRIASRWNGPAVSGEPAPRFHLVSSARYLSSYMHYPQRNVGTVACYDPVPWEISSALWIGDVPQARLVPAEAGEVGETQRTNHTFTAEVRLEADARLIINQNFDPGWRVDGFSTVADEGRLALDLPAGSHRVEARYAPSDLPWSLLTTLFGLLACVALLFCSPMRLAKLRRRPLAGLRGAEYSCSGAAAADPEPASSSRNP